MSMDASTAPYVLITPARNEAQFIELTIRSVVSQTTKPVRWVIVSDGSTDGTDEIVERYRRDHHWIELVRIPERTERSFSGKVFAFRKGYERVQELAYEYVGSLDGDTSFCEDYFEFLLSRLAGDERLGLAGTPFYEGSKPTYDYRFVNIEHVSGACQLFRRRCFEEIGGYVPVKGGGIDYIAVLSSRMKGWKTRTFTERVLHHHREIGTAQNGWWGARFKYGVKDYVLGNHPLWELFRGAYQMTKPPLVVGGLALVCGYSWACLKRMPRPVSDELMAFARREQVARLKRLFGVGATGAQSRVVSE